MKFIGLSKILKINLIVILILSHYSQLYSQTDSSYFFQTKITNCSSVKDAKLVRIEVEEYIKRSNKKSFIANTHIFLKAASQSEYSQYLFAELFYFLSNYSKTINLENEFVFFVIKLESSPWVTNRIIQNQLYYFYTLIYFHLKEYYYADKYCNLFLNNGKDAFENEIQTNYLLNAMTISALIDIEKNDLVSAHNKLNRTLDSSIAKNNTAWIGITKGNIGDIYYREGNFKEAIKHLNEDIRISLANFEYGSAINSYSELKDIYLKQQNKPTAYLYLDSAYTLLNQILLPNPSLEKEFLTESLDINFSLAKRYLENKDYINASKFFAKAYEIQHDKENNEKESHIKKIIQSDEIDRNINKINELHEEIENKKALTIYFQVIILAFIGILIIYIFFYQKLKFANKALLEKNEIIHAQNLELEKTNNDKDRLFSIISHDLRGPSKNLHLIFKAVGDKKLPFSTLESQMPNIIKNTNNLVNALESLLSWSESQLKGIKVDKILLDANEFIKKNIHFFEDVSLKKNIKLVNNCHSTMVRIDKNHMEIILRNLTSNAIKFSKHDSTIHFKLLESKDYVEVFIIDEGTGISEDQVNSILSNTAIKSQVGTSGEKGIGLGLLLTKEFIELNGGCLKIESALNKGTSMSFTIPKSV